MARKPIGSGRRARRHDPDWEPPIPGRRRVLKTWDEYMALAKRVVGRFHDKFELRHFDYWHPKRLQRRVAARFRKPYPVKIAYSDWGNPKNPTIVCCGGVANTAMRYLNDLLNSGWHPSEPRELVITVTNPENYTPKKSWKFWQ